VKGADWVIGLVVSQGRKWRGRSFAVAHAKVGRRLACGRGSIVKWAGYKKARIVAFSKPGPFERRCKRCEHALKGVRRGRR